MCLSAGQQIYAAVYCTPFHWISVDPIPSRKDAHKTLDSLFRAVRVSRVIIPDGGGELTGGELKPTKFKL